MDCRNKDYRHVVVETILRCADNRKTYIIRGEQPIFARLIECFDKRRVSIGRRMHIEHLVLLEDNNLVPLRFTPSPHVMEVNGMDIKIAKDRLLKGLLVGSDAVPVTLEVDTKHTVYLGGLLHKVEVDIGSLRYSSQIYYQYAVFISEQL